MSITERYRTLPEFSRLSEEYTERYLTPAEENERNLKLFGRTLGNFFLNSSSEERVRNLIAGNLSPDEAWLDEVLELDSQRRAWFKLSPSTIDQFFFEEYKRTIMQEGSFQRLSYYELQKIFEFNSFNTNTIADEHTGCTLRLFKLLRNKVFAKHDDAEDIVSRLAGLKAAAGVKYLVISRNPVDYLFCSTGQKFSSCLSLDSSYEGAFYLGLPSFMVDPNRFMMFLTSGRPQSYYCSCFSAEDCFSYLPIYARTWVLTGPQGFLPIKGYPNDQIPFDEMLRALGYPIYPRETKTSGVFFGKFTFNPLCNEDDDCQHAFMDSAIGAAEVIENQYKKQTFDISLRYVKSAAYPYTSMGGDLMPSEYHWSEGFWALMYEEFQALYGGESCENCGVRLSSDNVYTLYEMPYCENCFYDRAFYCSNCGEATPDDEGVYVAEEGETYCQHCADQLTSNCASCSQVFLNDATWHPAPEGAICQNCWENSTYTYCSECNEVFDLADTDHPDAEVCADCYKPEEETAQTEEPLETEEA